MRPPLEPADRTSVPSPSLVSRLTRRTAWPAWANLAAVAGVTLIALSQLHPSLLLANTTTAGGDTGLVTVRDRNTDDVAGSEQ